MVAVGVPRDRIAVIPNGVDIPAQPALPHTGNGPVRIGLLGRLDPQKGGDIFLQAAEKVGAAALSSSARRAFTTATANGSSPRPARRTSRS